jgi:hypothetical protein
MRVSKKGATVVLKLTTRGSFDEFFSIYWEALYNLGLTKYTPKLEALISGQLTVTDVENLATNMGLQQVESVTRKERFDYTDAQTFFEAPLIKMFFLNDWLMLLPDQNTRHLFQEEAAAIIDRERHGMDFDVSIKATLVMGRK